MIEDCIIEQPDLNQARESTLMVNRAEQTSPKVLATIRDNYFNGDFTTGSPPPAIEVLNVEYVDGGSNLKVRTRWPHRV